MVRVVGHEDEVVHLHVAVRDLIRVEVCQSLRKDGQHHFHRDVKKDNIIFVAVRDLLRVEVCQILRGWGGGCGTRKVDIRLSGKGEFKLPWRTAGFLKSSR